MANEPYKGHRHESKLLQEYRNKIFIDSQSKYPYYIAALIYSKIDHEYRAGIIPKELVPYKMHLCWMIKESLEPNSPMINDEKEIDRYCEQIKGKILNSEIWLANVQRVYQKFLEIQALWISEKGHSYKYGIKDSVDFFTFLQEQIRTSINKPITNDKPLQYRGTIIKISLDRHGKYYGFISKLPNDIFFHERDNPGLRFSTLYAHDVLYYTKEDKVTHKEHWKAIHRPQLINRKDIEILSKYNSETRGLYNYYSLACNVCAMSKFASLMHYSMLKTFANKYRTKTRKIKKKYFRDGRLQLFIRQKAV